MIITFSVGSKCSLMLPRKLINKHITPAKGLIINKLMGKRSLVLVEEVWQFEGISNAPLEKMCYGNGNIKKSRWGWKELPSLLKEDDYLVIPADDNLLKQVNDVIMEAMIKKSIEDFQKVNNFI